MKSLKQECPLVFVWLSWAIYVLVPVYLLLQGRLVFAAAWAVAAPLFQWLYLRSFPSISRWLGYGSVEDRAAAATPPTPARVTVYSASLCPFCPIVKRRLEALREPMGFELEVIDVTLNRDLVKAKRIRALPVVEVDGRQLVGNATSEELATFIRGS